MVIIIIIIIIMIIIIIIIVIIITDKKNFINKFSYKLKFTKYDLLVMKVIKIVIIIINKPIYNLLFRLA